MHDGARVHESYYNEKSKTRTACARIGTSCKAEAYGDCFVDFTHGTVVKTAHAFF